MKITFSVIEVKEAVIEHTSDVLDIEKDKITVSEMLADGSIVLNVRTT